MALAPTRQPYRFTVEEYLAFERASEERHEYLDGVIYAMAGSASTQAMAGESEDHGIICMNLSISLGSQLRGTLCRAFSKDTKVRCGPYRSYTREGLYAYPDLVVVCGPSQYHDQARDVLLNPTVIVEVLSPSTEAIDRGDKLYRYRRWLPTLTDYVLVAQDRPVIDHYQRTPTGSPAPVPPHGGRGQEQTRWELETLEGLDANLHLPSINCTVPLSEVYERIVFPQAEGNPTP
jgi:Uma2 family endonuclease